MPSNAIKWTVRFLAALGVLIGGFALLSILVGGGRPPRSASVSLGRYGGNRPYRGRCCFGVLTGGLAAKRHVFVSQHSDGREYLRSAAVGDCGSDPVGSQANQRLNRTRVALG